MIIAATTENWKIVMEAIEELLDKENCPSKTKFQILTAAEEVYVNIASYAYGDQTGDAEIEMSFDEASKIFTLSFSDSGVPYNPLEKEDADITLSAEERKIGGLGILMIKKLIDDVRYEYSGGKNHLVLIKNCG